MTPKQIAQLREILERMLQITQVHELTDEQIAELEEMDRQSRELIVAAAKADGIELLEEEE